MGRFRIGVLGAGNMGSALVRGIVREGVAKPTEVVVSDVDPSKLAPLGDEIGVRTTTDNGEAASAATVILAVKPQVLREVATEIGPHLKEGALVISIAAGVRLKTLEALLPERVAVVRVMPNIAVKVGRGISAYSLGSRAVGKHAEEVERIFGAIGDVFEVPEGYMDAITALSGSGIAFFFLLAEAMVDAGVRVGLPREVAWRVVKWVLGGAGEMALRHKGHPAELRELVTSPGGTTIAGQHALESGGFRGLVMDAIEAATQRARELSQ
ncbi:MAG TPA: pyrroline-5-carboxylate reductase [Armatimonadetes bacterium]|nr:pyrroline-5-carboxylate reductase [Armatimonadota bacterium]